MAPRDGNTWAGSIVLACIIAGLVTVLVAVPMWATIVGALIIASTVHDD